jgi:hypothetical protein
VRRTSAGPFGGAARWFRRTQVLAVLGGISLMSSVIVAGAGTVKAGASTSALSSSHTVWLCNPTKANDPCLLSRRDTSVSASGATTIQRVTTSAEASKFDCFYVYPTVSFESGLNSNLTIQPAEIAAAELQASRFSQVCRVWAPMYRQRTFESLVSGGLGGDKKANNIAYDSLLSGWRDYLAHDNGGRPVIFIGHSQGAAILIRLLHSVIDPSAALRHKMVSAIILGGNVQVPTGKDVGGSFTHIPTCNSAGQTGCVIAYSSFNTTPPANTLFGRPGQGVSLQSNQTKASGQQVACVNPVNFSTKPGNALPYFLSAQSAPKRVSVATPWVSYPGLYTVQCKHSGNATWLQVTSTKSKGDPRPVVGVSPTLGPTWGLHLDDINFAMGDLVLDVAYQEAAYK